MFKISYYTGKFCDQTREYTTAARAGRSVFNNLYKNMDMYYRVIDWMMSTEKSNKPHNLTVAHTIRVEYTPQQNKK